MMEIIRFTLNNKPVRFKVQKDRKLLWVLRTDLALTGTKYGCGEGFCGSCTVILNDVTVQSCQIPISEVVGKRVITIEGLARNGDLHPIQAAFMETNALQCGFCTPGMILKTYGLLKKIPQPTPTQIIEEMEGNLCRCGNYGRIIEAIQRVSRSQLGEKR